MKQDERKKLYELLSAPFPESAIERTKGRETGKGYDTAGVRAQYLINRINEVLGLGCYRVHRTITVRQVTSPKGRTLWEAICDMTLELGVFEQANFVVFAESLSDGGHTALSEADAKKGAHTNAFKRACAGFGIGREAWQGTLDDDAIPSEPQDLGSTAHHRDPPPGAVPTSHDPQRVNGTSGGPMIVTRPAPPTQPQRNRLSSKQLGAIWALARRLGFEQSTFRGQVKTEFGAALEFLSREHASQLIGRLSQKASQANGHAHHEGGDLGEYPGAQGN